MLFGLLLLPSMASADAPVQAPEPLREATIQVLASYHQGNPWTDELVGRVGEAVARLDIPGGLAVDYLDARRLQEHEAFELQLSRLAGRRAVTPADRLLLLDDAALRFYLDHRVALGDPPMVVALGINDPELRSRAIERDVRLIVSRPVERQSLAFLAEIFGAPLPLLVLGDRTPVGENLTNDFLSTLARFDRASLVDVLWDWDPAGVRTALAAAPAGTRVYLVEGQTTGAADLDAEARQWLPELADDGIPVFCHLPYQVSLGCAGGALLDTRRLGRLAVESLLSPAFERLPRVQEVGSGRQVLNAAFHRRLPSGLREDVEWLELDGAIAGADSRFRRLWWGAGWLGVALVAIILLLAWSRRRGRQQQQRLMMDSVTGLPTRQALEAGFTNHEVGRDGWLFELLSPGLREYRQRIGLVDAQALFREQLRMMRDYLPRGWRLHAGSDFGLIGVIPEAQGGSGEGDFNTFMARLDMALAAQSTRKLSWHASLLRLGGHDADLAQCCAALDDGLLRLERQGWRQPVIRVEPLDRDTATRFQRLSRDLERLIDAPGAEWRLMVQPKVSPFDGRLAGAEMLIRWEHPELGAISPGEFLPITEILGISARLDSWVMCRSLEWYARHRRQLSSLPHLAFNVNLATLAGSDFHGALAERIADLALAPGALELEITEHADFSDLESVEVVLGKLRRLGVRLALDDFGTGRTAFQLLQRLPLTSVKLDRSLLQAAGRHGRALDAYAAMVRFCDQLGLAVVAEGVETRDEAHWLMSLGIQEVQGFLYARPMELDDFLVRYGRGGGE
ncbi:EAL domain-containing protein [Halomonas sp. C05BenzN]|uniref:EAL domain-containing protein n=1 Tax=Halomonas sp. C05BenzN TaxID=3411041 RepID=UPI003B9588AC